jgi:hypothetical protein
VYDAAAHQLRLYVNGELAGTANGVTLWNAPGHFRIGQSTSGGAFGGSIADVRVWDRALPAAEVLDMVDPTSAANVSTMNVGQWLVEPESCFGSPVTCGDSSSYAHDLKLSGDVATTVAGQVGSGLSYSGVNGVASSTDPNTGLEGATLHTDQSFTVSAWVKLSVLPTTTDFTAIGQSGEEVSGFWLGALHGTGSGNQVRWSFGMSADDHYVGGRYWFASAPNVLTAANVGQWVHLVGVFDAVRKTQTLYVNGTVAATTTRTGPAWDAHGALTIGAARWEGAGPGIDDWWNGTIDTVYAYAGAVPASSISRIP